MDEQILKKIEEQEKKLDEVYRSVEKLRKYFLWTLIITAIIIVLPLVGLLFVIPNFLSVYNASNLGL